MSLKKVYEKSLTEGYFIDTVFYLYSKKTVSGKVFDPKPVYASSKLLTEASPYFSHSKSRVLLTNATILNAISISVLSGTFREGRYGNIDSGFPEDEPSFIEDYEYDSDSDLELDDSEDEDISVPWELSTCSDDYRAEPPPPERSSAPVVEETQAILIPALSAMDPRRTFENLPETDINHDVVPAAEDTSELELDNVSDP